MTDNIENDSYAMDRYSRQIGAYGVEAMAKLIKLKVLVTGLGGVGIETAKNLALAGPGAITLHDEKVVEVRDLGSNFFLKPSHVGTETRAQASMKSLQELNRLVRVSQHCGNLTEEVVKQHNVVVASCMSPQDAKKWNAFCRTNGISFIQTEVFGAMGYCFVDHGNQFTVRDKTGEQPVQRIVHSISNEEKALVSLIPPPDGRRHNMDVSDHDGWISFDELDGPMGELLNDKGPFKIDVVHTERLDAKTGKKIKRFDPYSLRIDVDTTKVGKYSGGGTITQVKKPVLLPFRSLEHNLQQPVAPGEFGLLFTDGAKFGRAEQLHIALCGLSAFQTKHNRLPEPNNETEANEVADLAQEYNETMKKQSTEENTCFFLEELDKDIAVRVAMHAACELQPMAAFFGGVVAQEVVKITGKFSPLHQWLHIDAFEVLPDVLASDDTPTVSLDDRKPIGSRYDDLIMMFGKSNQEKLTNMSTFLVGCGALGCELLKNFAMLGIATKGDAKITVTDNDRIEVSNLSRQFLFREHNVGQAKSVAGADAAIEMNQDIQIKALEQFVGPKTEDIFNDQFWESLDFVTNALDNVTARMYVDSRCVFYGKPLLESGTLGTKCNVQIVLPHQTQSYADGPNDNDDGDAIPMCTLRNFPSQIEHCIEWARAQFNDLFTMDATEASNFIQDPKGWLNKLRSKTIELNNAGLVASAVAKELIPLKAVYELLRKSQSGEACFADCVKTAYLMFHRVFRDKIDSLITQYPADATDARGELFWSGTKRFPQSAVYDSNNPVHMMYIISMANILAVNYGLQPPESPVPADHPWRNKAHVQQIMQSFSPPDAIQEKVDMSGQSVGEEPEENEEKETAVSDSDEQIAEFNELLVKMESLSEKVSKLSIEPADFEKDADWNFHIDFITAASNLRAWNYRLKEVSRHKAKMIAGKIIPAIATTTASVTGLVMLEMLKMAQKKKIEAYKDSSNSLGINAYFFSEPSPPAKEKDEYDVVEMAEVKCRPPGFTKWDKTTLRLGDVTLRGLIDGLEKETGLNCTSLYHKSADEVGAKGNSRFLYEKYCHPKTKEGMYEKRMTEKATELVKEIYGDDVIGRSYIPLEVQVEDNDGQVYKIPSLVFFYKV